MTYQEIKDSEKLYLTSEDVKEIMEASQYNITLQARERPDSFPFSVVIIGTRVKFPRISFLQFCERDLGLNK